MKLQIISMENHIKQKCFKKKRHKIEQKNCISNIISDYLK